MPIPVPNGIGKNCPDCGMPLVTRINKFDVEFVGCMGYPECNYSSSVEDPLGRVVPTMQDIMGDHYQPYVDRGSYADSAAYEDYGWNDPFTGSVWGDN